MAAASSVSAMSAKTDVLTVFLTGNELGSLRPCGCSGGQLGGLDRRMAVFNTAPQSRRFILDTGQFVETDSDQDIIKFNIVIQAFALLGYDLVNLTEKDIEIAENLHLLDGIGSVFNVISCYSPADANLSNKFTKQMKLNGKTIAITVAAFDTESTPIEQIGELFATASNLPTVNILIINRCNPDIIDSVAKTAIVDCLICPAESDQPGIISLPDQKPLVVSMGRLGKYVGKLQIRFDEAGKKKLEFTSVPVTEDLPQEKSLVQLYEVYQQLVKEENLLAKYPKFALPNGLEYLGSKSCKPCHDYEYEKWSTKAHAHAYATLEKVGSQYDPECALCHVVGAEYETGFVSEGKTPHLKNVGCENCHGPGSEHIKTLAKTTQPMLDCTDCHTPENSSDYTGNEQLYFGKIIHWREPNNNTDVKNNGR